MNTVLWVVGEPGVGKTSLVREMVQLAAPRRIYRHPKPKWDVQEGGLALAGHYDGGKFDGADTMPISNIWPAVEYWNQHLIRCKLTVFDGDKFSNPKILEAIRQDAPAHDLRCLHLWDSPEAVLARRTARGTSQNPTWVAGRKTKAVRFATHFPGETAWSVNLQPFMGQGTLRQLAQAVLSWVGHG